MRARRSIGVLIVYLALAAVYTRPLLELAPSRIAGNAGDPILNTSVLWWNATTTPFSERWWNPPYFFPSRDISAFTENLVGISPFATPLYWLTRNPLTTYNVCLFLAWPLSAFSVYLLVAFLTTRRDAAFLAGLAYGFSPYRTAELGHIQMVSVYWIPLALLGLHGYLVSRRPLWLALFGVCWVLQSLANMYMMLFGAVLIAVWLLYFCSTRSTWRAAPAILTAWALASAPLLPIVLKYQAVHDYYGLRRIVTTYPLLASVSPSAWAEVSGVVWLWHRVFPDGKDNLFPGIVAAALVLAAIVVALRRPRPDLPKASGRQVALSAVLLAVTAASLAAIVVTLITGPWRLSIAGITLRMTYVDRALALMLIGGGWFLLRWPRFRDAFGRRSLFMFYTAATLLMASFSLGPVLRAGDSIIFDAAPYHWLLYLPGFEGLRVPTRFWMLGILCLAVAAGLAFIRLPLGRRSFRVGAFAVLAGGLAIDGWMRGMPMAEAPVAWPLVEPADRPEPILELPLGPDWDPAATYRSLWHRRRVVNGVSGYDPPHYEPLLEGLKSRDPDMLLAVAYFGPFDAVVDGASDPTGEWRRYVSGVPGVALAGTDGTRTVYRVPAAREWAAVVGERLPIERAQSFLPDAHLIVDGRLDTELFEVPQRPGQWISVDLGAVRDVGGVTAALGDYSLDFPRRLAIDLSLDGIAWHHVWEGPTAAQAFLAAAIGPREGALRFSFPASPARLVRLRQLAHHQKPWRIAEVHVHAPAPR